MRSQDSCEAPGLGEVSRIRSGAEGVETRTGACERRIAEISVVPVSLEEQRSGQ